MYEALYTGKSRVERLLCSVLTTVIAPGGKVCKIDRLQASKAIRYKPGVARSMLNLVKTKFRNRPYRLSMGWIHRYRIRKRPQKYCVKAVESETLRQILQGVEMMLDTLET
jgi:hypothetical protein